MAPGAIRAGPQLPFTPHHVPERPPDNPFYPRPSIERGWSEPGRFGDTYRIKPAQRGKVRQISGKMMISDSPRNSAPI